ncbi:MAG: hypothetical protein AAB214_21470 [Fibrobacterota bacterium]
MPEYNASHRNVSRFRTPFGILLTGMLAFGCSMERGVASDGYQVDSASIAPLQARDLSRATSTPYVALTRADLESIDTANRSKIVPWLKACSRTDLWGVPGEGDDKYRPGGDPAQNKLDAFLGESAWLTRALSAYIRVRRTATTEDRSIIDAWFFANAGFCMLHMQSFLDNNFPNRTNDDYTKKNTYALSAAYMGRRTTWQGDEIPNLATWYNNRRSIEYGFLALMGAFYADIAPEKARPIVAEVKRYVKEWVTYSVFPTGETGEWVRNHSYPNADSQYIEAQGMIYNAYNSATALNAALWFYLKLGDRDLLDFRTRDGLWGTQCETGEPDKSIWTASDLHIDMLAGVHARLNDDSVVMNPLFNYPDAENRNRLLHASWFVPAYRTFRSKDSGWSRLDTWVKSNVGFKRYDDPFGIWRNIAGISHDVRTEEFDWLKD